VVFATKRWLGAYSPGNLELLRGKYPAPFFITFYNFISHIQLLILGRLGGVFLPVSLKNVRGQTPKPTLGILKAEQRRQTASGKTSGQTGYLHLVMVIS
jgi:hypothetical protein